jgi:flagellar protein FliO/FliZ
MNRFLFTLVAAFAAAGAQAETARPFASPTAVDTVTPSGVASLGQVTLSLGLVLAVIFAAAWVMRKSRAFGGKSAAGALNVVANLPLGQKERAVLIRVGDTQILLGVAPGRVSTLHVLSTPVAMTPDASSPQDLSAPQRPSFKALLMKGLGKS